MFTINCKGRLLVVDKPLVMGILNITPDSFYEKSRVSSPEKILALAKKMIGEGADMLDVGAQSTRPGAEIVGQEEELSRIIPVIELLIKNFPNLVLSIDTFNAEVAEKALMAGASIVNDISGGSFDNKMLATVARQGAAYICMHVRGDAETMHQHNNYNTLMLEIIDYFIQKKEACRSAGINDLIIDPGFGFSKTIDNNFELLQKFESLQLIGLPILLGVSRKSTIYKTLNDSAENALNGTTVLNSIGLLKGASILRVHDVKEAREAVTLIDQYKKAGNTWKPRLPA